MMEGGGRGDRPAPFFEHPHEQGGPRLRPDDDYAGQVRVVVVEGKGGYAAWPDKVVDPIAMGAQIVTNLRPRSGNISNAWS